MNKILYLAVLLSLSFASRGQMSGYIQTINNQTVNLDTTDGRKILIVILPAQPDTALAGQLTRFQGRHGKQIRIVAIAASGTAALTSMVSGNAYSNLPESGIILTQGIADAAATAGPRTGILKYLSQKSRNRGVDRFAEGSKYFLSEKGRLFAQLGKNGSLDSRLADYIVQTVVPGENRY